MAGRTRRKFGNWGRATHAVAVRGLPWAEIVVSLIALAIAAGIYLYAHRDEGALEEAKDRGDAIVEALQRHRIEQGDYPGTLEDLVPSYLPALEPPNWGRGRWSYERYTRSAAGGAAATGGDTVFFRLSVAADESGYPLLFYDITEHRWVLNN